MAKHYVCRTTDLPAYARSEAEKLCGSGRGITPAWVEQCSAESDDFDGLVKQLKVRTRKGPEIRDEQGSFKKNYLGGSNLMQMYGDFEGFPL